MQIKHCKSEEGRELGNPLQDQTLGGFTWNPMGRSHQAAPGRRSGQPPDSIHITPGCSSVPFIIPVRWFLCRAQESPALQLCNEQLPPLSFLGAEYLFSSSSTSKEQILIMWIGRACYREAMGGSGAAPSDITQAAWPSLHPVRAIQ